MLAKLLQEVVSAWTFQHVDIAELPIDVNWNHIVRFLNEFELAVHQCFVQVKNQGLLAFALVRLGAKQARSQFPLL